MELRFDRFSILYFLYSFLLLLSFLFVSLSIFFILLSLLYSLYSLTMSFRYCFGCILLYALFKAWKMGIELALISLILESTSQ
jgi:membrane protein required for colicin V production